MGSKVTVIRPFAPGDVDDAVRLERAHQPNPWTEGIFRDELAADGRIYLVAEDEAILGYGGVFVIDEEAHVTNLLVDASARGRGLGRRLMAELIRAAVSAGARHLTLEVRSRNTAARSLYSSMGLGPVGVRPGYYGDDDALILWAHDIDRSEFLERLP